MYICMPAEPVHLAATRRIVARELRLRHCPPDQITDAQLVVTELATPLCRAAAVREYGLTIQRSLHQPGAITLRVSARGHGDRRNIPLPRPHAELLPGTWRHPAVLHALATHHSTQATLAL
ncbi:ATP-binding protein [Streptomyces griseoviridis]|uniref:ATP-binding protein n=1 Tax=Streptomyces griseoviridis TaxID=45398 RepID=UPI003402F1A9